MDVRSTILVNNRVLYLQINTTADYLHKHDIPLKEWLDPRRYEFRLRLRALRNPAPDQQDERYKPRTTTQGQSEQPAKEE